jgi:uncharacterized protein YkwD
MGAGRALLFGSTFAALLLGAAAASANAACDRAREIPAPGGLDAAAEATVCEINEERARRGRAPLRENPSLARAAIRYSRVMVARRFFGHVTPWGEDLRDRLLGSGYVSRAEPWQGAENLGWGTGALSTPAAMVTGWMESPGHRANLLDGRWQRLGVGVVPGTPRRTPVEGATYTLLLGSVDRGASRARTTKRVMVGRKVRGGS